MVLSAFGVGESRKLANFLLDKLVISWILKAPFEDHERQEKLVRESGLDWVIAQPASLLNSPGKHGYQKKSSLERAPGSIARADVADFLVEADETDNWSKKAVQLGG